jgi:ferredoxin-like protein FixX
MITDVDRFLALNKYEINEAGSHIKVDLEGSDTEFEKLMLVCPAGLYKRDAQGHKSFDYAGCLECGTCRICCGDTIVKKWGYPGPALGVEYRYG